MATEVIMPKVDMDQESGTVVEWCKQNGERVQQGEILLVIETDKIAIDVESPGSGILAGVSAQIGDKVPIGKVIAYLLADGEALPGGEVLPAKPTATVAAPAAQKPQAPPATPVAKNMATVLGIDLATVIPSGKRQQITKVDVQAKLTGERLPEGKTYASPAARRVAQENQVELTAVLGSGPKGRIQTSDVLTYLESQNQAEGLDSVPSEQVVKEEPTVIPLIGMRRTIAERMTANYQSIPHIRFTARVDMTGFGTARNKLNELAEKMGGQKISATVMFVKLVATSLRHHPFLNSSLRENEILLHPDINIGVAVALENGLIVPVVRNADRKGLAEIAAEVDDLTTRARTGKLQSADVKGGTFTISNLGPFGIEQFDAIINAPEAAILAIGATQLEAIPTKDGQITARPIMRMTLSADHRVIDGVVAAHFVSDLKTLLEEPVLIAY